MDRATLHPATPTTPRAVVLLASLALGAGGCGSYSGNLEGTLGGSAFKPVVGYWGGPFVTFSDDDLDCLDLWWVAKDYDEENPFGQSFSLLQVTFQDSEVVAGSFEVSGASPVDAAWLIGDAEGLIIDEALSGTITIEDFDGAGKIKGNLSLELVSGSVSGDFKVDHCANLSSAY